MIRPEEYEGAITSLRFLCGCTASDRQYTFVEITVEARTDRDIAVSFCIPDGAEPRDEHSFLSALSGVGGSVVNEAMDAWGECRTDSTLRTLAAAADIQDIGSPLSTEISGCAKVATVVIPSGGSCAVNACWSHKLLSKTIVVPTFNENLTSWRVDAIVMHGNSHNHGKSPKHSFSRSFRHDLASSVFFTTGEQPFLPTDGAFLLQRWGPSLPYHNICVSVAPNEPRVHRSLCGSVLVDKTTHMLMTFYDVMFVAVACVCGSFIRNSISYPRSYVPLTVSERLSRNAAVEFRDAADGSPRVDICIDGIVTHRIDPRKRTVFNTLHWVDLEEQDVS